MPFPFYRISVEGVPVPTAKELPAPWRSRIDNVTSYRPDPGLVDAVNVALLLGQPLLLTGEPGCGKTQLAWHVSWQLLGLDTLKRPREPLVFEAKSTSTARDLFYSFDTLGRFHKARENSTRDVDYISYSALGKAILLANEHDAVSRWLPDSGRSFEHDGPRRSVVLIDEVDKAPRDFPNDILNEVENMYFRVPELTNEVIGAPADLKPILIITSNSEKSLPAPFLRRCIYYNISFPDRARMKEILEGKLGGQSKSLYPYLAEAMDFFFLLREDNARMRKKPATAELLGWLVYLGDRIPQKNRTLRENREVLEASLCALVKSAEDQANATEQLRTWLAGLHKSKND